MQSLNILILALTEPSSDPRPMRAVEYLHRSGNSVTINSLPAIQKISGVTYIPIIKPDRTVWYKLFKGIFLLLRTVSMSENAVLLFNKFLFFFIYKQLSVLNKEQFDLILVEDLQMLPLAFKLKGKAKILFDAREYYPLQNEENFWFNLLEKRVRHILCDRFLKECHQVLTVSKGLSKAYLENYGIDSLVFKSCPRYSEGKVRLTNPETIRIVYHGMANRNRKLDNLIKIADKLDRRFSLDLILIDHEDYQQELKEMVKSVGNVRILRPVSYKDIHKTLTAYDIGIFYCEPSTFNLLHSLPNKFFEFIQARLMVAIGPSPDMAELVNKYRCGLVSEEFSVESITMALNGLTSQDIDTFKRNSDLAARELSFEMESEKLLSIVSSLQL